jgi:hypothetical protein
MLLLRADNSSSSQAGGPSFVGHGFRIGLMWRGFPMHVHAIGPAVIALSDGHRFGRRLLRAGSVGRPGFPQVSLHRLHHFHIRGLPCGCFHLVSVGRRWFPSDGFLGRRCRLSPIRGDDLVDGLVGPPSFLQLRSRRADESLEGVPPIRLRAPRIADLGNVLRCARFCALLLRAGALILCFAPGRVELRRQRQ